MKTVRQNKGAVTNRAVSRRRWCQLQDMSKAGRTKAEAAEALGLKVSGVDTILYRYEGSTVWPIKQ